MHHAEIASARQHGTAIDQTTMFKNLPTRGCPDVAGSSPSARRGALRLGAASRAVASTGLILLCLASCSTIEPVVATSPDLPASYANADLGPRRDMNRWWRGFRDPVLDRLVERARSQNLSIAQAQARLAAGRRQSSAAPSLFLPSVGGSGQALAGNSREQIEDPLRRPLLAGFDTSWDAGLFGLAENTEKVAAASAAIAGDELDAVRIAVTAEVAASYISLRSVQRQIELTSALAAVQERAAQFARSRARTGISAAGEDASEVAVLDQARSDLSRLEARASALRQQIATLVGASAADAALNRAAPQPMLQRIPAAGRPADLLRARPDVRAAEHRVLKAAAEVGIAKADLYPRLRLGGTIGLGGPSPTSPFGLAGGPSLQIPLFDYGRREAALHARRALVEEALASYRQTVLTAYQEAAAALGELRAARESRKQLSTTIEAQRRSDRRLRVLRREGLADVGRLAESEAGMVALQRKLVAQQEAEALAFVTLYKALGAAAEGESA
ncbi:efflux transporter outer membrane subunit [Bosea sp. TND4EK4]|uniref:efflux transporter outer membrane subunit n=1 Tax=Bosea sp. TND4EK4 TaxID=1907408 RepID=UPI000954AC0A|nr:efflux transporter outer membrane subunit [Bosea sp. TND4EK4]SIR50744.1 efflux transporter, outer membrane factor (OMF) lipoprotein, NodT family [Bosea sp. TND4EK4]